MTETETTETKDEQLAERHGFVDFDKIDDPETRKAVQERIHGLYQSQKDAANVAREAQRMYAAMEKRLADIEARDRQKETTSRLEQVRKGLVDANSKGDYETAAKYQEQLVDLKAAKPVAEKPQTDGIEERNAEMLMVWQSTLTDDGRIARPWAHRTHPKYNETISQLTEVTDDPEFKSKGFAAILKEVDRRMMPKPSNAAPVSDGDATPNRPSGKTVQLTEGQKKAATRLYPSMKPAEAIKRYAEANKKYGDQ